MANDPTDNLYIVKMKAGKTRGAARKYHHGNLRPVLIEAAARIADEDGIQALSLRRLARAASVSHAAPYHHFKSKAELIAAIAEEGIAMLKTRLEEARAARAGDPPREVLRELGLVYIRFALEHPHFFRIMFRPELYKAGPASPGEPLDPGFLVLIGVLQDHLGETGAPSPRVLDLALFAWTTIHGLTSLWLDGSLEDTPVYVQRTPDELAGRVMDLFERCL